MCSIKSRKSLPDHIHMASDLRLADIGSQLPVNLSFPIISRLPRKWSCPPKRRDHFKRKCHLPTISSQGAILVFWGSIYTFSFPNQKHMNLPRILCAKKYGYAAELTSPPKKKPAICLGILHMKIPVSPVMATVAMSQIPEPFRNRYVCSLLGEGLKATFPAEVYPKWWWLDHWIIPGLVGGDRITRIYRPVG